MNIHDWQRQAHTRQSTLPAACAPLTRFFWNMAMSENHHIINTAHQPYQEMLHACCQVVQGPQPLALHFGGGVLCSGGDVGQGKADGAAEAGVAQAAQQPGQLLRGCRSLEDIWACTEPLSLLAA